MNDSDREIIVREASLDDAELLAEMTRKAWAGKMVDRSTGHSETKDSVLNDLQQGGAFILYADGKPVGFLRWRPKTGESHIWFINRMGILPEERGQGLSEHLLEAIIHHAYMSEITEIQLALYPEHDRLVDFYAIFGFNLAPEIEIISYDPLMPDPIMLKKELD